MVGWRGDTWDAFMTSYCFDSSGILLNQAAGLYYGVYDIGRYAGVGST